MAVKLYGTQAKDTLIRLFPPKPGDPACIAATLCICGPDGERPVNGMCEYGEILYVNNDGSVVLADNSDDAGRKFMETAGIKLTKYGKVRVD